MVSSEGEDGIDGKGGGVGGGSGSGGGEEWMLQWLLLMQERRWLLSHPGGKPGGQLPAFDDEPLQLHRGYGGDAQELVAR